MRAVKMFVVGAFAVLVAGSAFAQSPVPSLQDLIGAKGRDGEYQMQQRGYDHIKTNKSGGDAYSYWQQTENGQCVVVRTSDGRYASIVYTDYSDCSGRGGASHPSHEHHEVEYDRREEFQTVCGVMVGGQNYRYKCKAVDFYDGRQLVRTGVHYPDITLQLVWKGPDQVAIHIPHTKKKIVRYSTSEGETNFQMDGKTYFFISDRRLAEMEARNFQR